MRWPILVAGALLDFLGAVWILQGFNVLPGSRMSGDRFWAGAGLVLMVVGLTLIISIRRNRATT